MSIFNSGMVEALLPYLKGRNEGITFISQEILTGSVAGVEFADIPQVFNHLLFVLHLRTDRATEIDRSRVYFNNDTAATYDWELVIFNNATVTALGFVATSTTFVIPTEAANSRADNFAPSVLLVPNYRSDNEKHALLLSGAVYGDVSAAADVNLFISSLRWRDDAAISVVDFVPNIGPNFVTGSQFAMYGIK